MKDSNEKSYSLFIWFLCFLHLVAAAWVALKTTNDNIKLSMYVLLGYYAVISIGYFFLRNHKRSLEIFSLMMALLYANFWFTQIGLVALLIFAAVYVFAILVKGKKTTVQFSAKGAQLGRLFKTTDYPWPQIDNVILKDNILTIDFKSNKIIQAEIVEGSEVVDEKDFNGFCTEQLQQLA